MFRQRDRDAMLQAFGLFDYDDVVENARKIARSLRGGQMPCDGAWSGEQLDKLQHWIDAGTPA